MTTLLIISHIQLIILSVVHASISYANDKRKKNILIYMEHTYINFSDGLDKHFSFFFQQQKKSSGIRFGFGSVHTFLFGLPTHVVHLSHDPKMWNFSNEKTKLINGWNGSEEKKPYTFHANRIWLHISFTVMLWLTRAHIHTLSMVYVSSCFSSTK